MKKVLIAIIVLLATVLAVYSQAPEISVKQFAVDNAVYFSDGMFNTGLYRFDAFANNATIRIADETSFRFALNPSLGLRASAAVAFGGIGDGKTTVYYIDIPLHLGVHFSAGVIALDPFAGYYLALGDFPKSGLEVGARVSLFGVYFEYTQNFAQWQRYAIGYNFSDIFSF